MKRFGQVIGLRPEKLEEYKRYHAAVWPEILDALRKAGIRNYSIFHFDGKLFAYFEYHGPPDQFDERRQLESGRWNLTFIAFNSTEQPRQSAILFPLAMERAATIAIDQAEPVPLSAGRYDIKLQPGEARWLKVSIPNSR